MDFAPTEQPDGLPDGQLAERPPTEQPADPPAYTAPIQPVVPPARRSRSKVVGAIVAGAIGLTAVAVAIGSTGTPAVATPLAASAQGVLLAADTGTWTAPSGGGASAPNVTGMMGDLDGAGFGPGGFGPGGMGRGGRMGERGIFGAISITAIDGTKLSLRTADGWTRTIDATGATVTKSGQTVALSTLKVGDAIVFDQARQADGTLKVTAIRVVLPHAGGMVKSVTDSSVTLTQRDGTEKVLQLTASTTYNLAGAASTKGALRVGTVVVAEGTTSADGTFTATVVHIRPALTGGTVTAKSATSITVKARDGSSLTITVGSGTTYQVAGKATAALSDIVVGAIVTAQGTANADGTFTATVVRTLPIRGSFGGGGRMGPGMRGGRGMPWGPGGPGLQPAPTPTGTTN